MPVSVWTSTLRRTIQTAELLPFPKLRWKVSPGPVLTMHACMHACHALGEVVKLGTSSLLLVFALNGGKQHGSLYIESEGEF